MPVRDQWMQQLRRIQRELAQEQKTKTEGGLSVEEQGSTASVPQSGIWYFACTSGKFHKSEGAGYLWKVTNQQYTVPTFEYIVRLYGTRFPENVLEILFLPKFSEGTYDRYKLGLEAIIKAYRLKRDGTRFFTGGELTKIFDDYERDCRNSDKVVIVDLGYYKLNSFLRGKYTSVQDLR